MNLEEISKGLRERAKEAHKEVLEQEADELRYQQEELISEAQKFCADTLGTVPDYSSFTPDQYTYSGVRKPSVRFVLDGIRFRARYVPKKTTWTSGGEQQSVTEDVFVLEIRRKTTSETWAPVTCLADVGKEL